MFSWPLPFAFSRPASLFAVALLLASCVDWPDVGSRETATLEGPYPRLAPIEGLILRAIGPSRSGGATVQEPGTGSRTLADVEAQIARLRARAAILRGAPINDEPRALLVGGGV